MAPRAGPRSACPICDSTSFRPSFVQYAHRFEACRTCGFVRMADPPPDGAVLAEYEVDRSHGETIWEHHDQFLGIFDAIVARIERHRGGAKGRLLDIGCSYGNALLAARARGWEVAGIELSRPAAEYGVKAYGLDIRIVELEHAQFEPQSFDAILMHHVLEHVLAPDALVRQVHALLRPGGIHYQALPNWRCLKRFLLGSCWGYGVTSNHLSLFTPRTLRRLLRNAGFAVVESFTRSYREDPRLIFDVMRRLGLVERFMAARGQPGQPFDPADYVRWIDERWWARFVSHRMWPQRIVGALGLGEEVHAVVRKV